MKSFIPAALHSLTTIALLLLIALIAPCAFAQILNPAYPQQPEGASIKSVAAEQQNEVVKDKEKTQSQEEETPALREKKLIERMETIKARMDSLQRELNELRLRVLQNRPRNPLVFGDPYYVDPKLREQIAKVRRQLLETQMEFENLVNEIEGR